jgi:hypothetical protein
VIKRRHKYGAKRTEVDGILFDSQKEARRYVELKLAEKAGEIRNLRLQPEFLLTAELMLGDISRERDPAVVGKYRGDFAYEERLVPKGGPVGLRREWREVVEDVKGFDNPLSRWKRRHVQAQYGITVRLT